ncbi:uncharacterized protein F4822DRAFT_188319 [Hypoxylon trugodes]|uniref:uncharacterized protein n=1 Tax=Hypoxylon trugodes TaxID=326681 RepID=UPI0021A09BDE|nr:uncharacterized protein F4822DRAFT_188319 [Hypoxylon trugodes]KAI1391530.1 hypothetical protein F4822DRAFT_188319 [Hypoxylon trugodes]
MADEDLLHRIHALEDLDLAALLCLVSREHCIVSTEPAELDTLIEELRLVASQTFNLSSTVVDCTSRTTLDDLAISIQLPPPTPTPNPPLQLQTPARRTSSVSPLRRRGTESSYFHGHSNSNAAQTPTHTHHTPQIANIILAKNLDRAPRDVQIQSLELIRTRRILTRTSVQTAPKQFLFIAVLEPAGASRLVTHLNDLFYVSHWHDPEDGFAHLEDGGLDLYEDGDDGKGGETASLDSASSVVRRSTVDSITATPKPKPGRSRSASNIKGGNYKTRDDRSILSSRSRISAFPRITESDIATLALLARQTSVDVEVLRYQMNIVSFLRMHRAAAPGGGGATPLATQHFGQLSKCLAALHGLDYVTPALVGLAARKVYAHRFRVVEDPIHERSMQWGSDLAAVEALLEGVGAEDVIEDVLSMVEAPL